MVSSWAYNHRLNGWEFDGERFRDERRTSEAQDMNV